MSAVTLTREEDVARIVLGDGKRVNVLSSADWRDLAEQVTALAADPSLRAVVVSGTGTAGFSAGSDMREWAMADPADVDTSFDLMEAACTAIERLPVPVVASIRGVAAGAGCQLACACDLRIITEEARIGMPVARWGILVPPAFAARIVMLAGADAARDLLYTGRFVGGVEAARIRLATRCVPDAELEAATAQVVAAITAQPPSAVRAAKHAVSVALTPIRAAAGDAGFGPTADYEDLQRGLAAFLPPNG